MQFANGGSKPEMSQEAILCTAIAIQGDWQREQKQKGWLLVTTVGDIFMLISPQRVKSFFPFVI